MRLISLFMLHFTPNVLKNARLPKTDAGGKFFLWWMNRHHQELYKWGLSKVDLSNVESAADIGCGSGFVVRSMLESCPNANVFGVDASEQSVKAATSQNKKEIGAGRCKIYQGDAEHLPFEAESLDVITGFETIYYWPDLVAAFKACFAALKPGGQLAICNEDSVPAPDSKLCKIIDMRIDTPEMIAKAMNEAGFPNVHLHEQGEWVCAVARKPA